MPTRPAITPTNLTKPTPELPEFEVRISLDHNARVRAVDEDTAVEQVWEQIMNEGAWGLEVTEQEDEDGAS